MAQLRFGDIAFHTKNSPKALRISRGNNFPEQERLGGGPTLQDVGGKLTTIQVDIRLHVSLGSIQDRYDALKALMLSKEPKPFINGAGYSEGDFVIETMEITLDKLDALGRPIDMEISLSLKEFLDINTPDAEELAARKAATATIQANPILVRPTVKYQSPKSLVMRDITTGTAGMNSAAVAAKQAASVPDLVKKSTNTMKQALVTARNGLAAARDGVSTVQGQISNAVNLKNTIISAIDTVNDTFEYIESTSSPSPATVGIYGASLEIAINAVLQQASQLSTLTALRR